MGIQKIKFVDGDMYSYEIHNIIDKHSPSLREVTPVFDFANPPVNPKYLSISLIETMVNLGGVGLAAPQCGLPYRVFVMGAQGVGFACFNPEILEFWGEEKMEEGCLSFPGLFLPVTRHANVKVRYTDWNNVTKEETFGGLTARIFQHEFAHLDGKLFVNEVSPIILDRANGKVKVNMKKIQRQREANKTAKKIAELAKKVKG